MSKAKWLFVAAAKGLQGYVLRSDPLKEMVGASELIETLPRTDEFAGDVLKLLGVTKDEIEILSDTAGGVRILFREEIKAKQLIRVWPLLMAQKAPGLEVAVALVEVKGGSLSKAIEDSETQINHRRQSPIPDVPEAGPCVARNRRTGLPASTIVEALKKREAEDKDVVDLESAQKRKAADDSKATLLDKLIPGDGKFDCLRPGSEKFKDYWTNDLTKLVSGEDSYVAVVHADVNGLGTAIMRAIKELPENFDKAADQYQSLCKTIKTITEQAAQTALLPLLERSLAAKGEDEKMIRFRPLVCAGEDFTFVIQAKDAVAFVRRYLEALEEESKKRFGERGIHHFKDGLTGCAGIAFCKSHYPFSRAYAMAESLCGFAKKRTDRKASALAFLRLKSSIEPSADYETVARHAFMAGKGEQRVFLSMNPYRVGDVSRELEEELKLPKLSDLRALQTALDDKDKQRDQRLPRSGLRELVSRTYEGKSSTDQAFERLKLITQERDQVAKEGQKAWPPFAEALKNLTGNGLWKKTNEGFCTPLYDALELKHLKTEFKSKHENSPHHD